MKVSDGFWLNQPGYNVNYATQIYNVEADDTSVTVHATNQWIANRGMTLGGPVLTVRFTSTLENSIKVTIEHFKGALKKAPSFELYEDSSFKPIIRRLPDGGYELVSGKTSVRIGGEKTSWNISPRKAGARLLSSRRRNGSAAIRIQPVRERASSRSPTTVTRHIYVKCSD